MFRKEDVQEGRCSGKKTFGKEDVPPERLYGDCVTLLKIVKQIFIKH